jgi:hypothetical protein
MRFEGGAVNSEGEHNDKADGDEPVGRHRVEKHADDGAEQEHGKSVITRKSAIKMQDEHWLEHANSVVVDQGAVSLR